MDKDSQCGAVERLIRSTGLRFRRLYARSSPAQALAHRPGRRRGDGRRDLQGPGGRRAEFRAMVNMAGAGFIAEARRPTSRRRFAEAVRESPPTPPKAGPDLEP